MVHALRFRWVALVLAVGCSAPGGGAQSATTVVIEPGKGTGDPTPATRSSSRAPGAPVIVNNRLLDPNDAHVIALIPDVRNDAVAVPVRDGTGHFEVGGLIVDGTSGDVVEHAERLRIDGDHLVRREPRGAQRWSVPLNGAGSVRPPDVAVAGGVDVASMGGWLFAFDDTTGAPLWKTAGPADRLATDGTYFFTTDCSSHVSPRWLVARRVKDGSVAWRAGLPDPFDPNQLLVDARHVVAFDPSAKVAVFFDHTGQRLFELDESVSTVVARERGVFIVSDQHLASVDDDGTPIWRRAPLPHTFVAGNDVLRVGGDLLIANYGAISDSGAEIVRLRASDGALVWETSVPPLGVGHSEYEHRAYLDLRGPSLLVVSQGSGGSFFERIDVATGKRELRCILDEPAHGGCTTPH